LLEVAESPSNERSQSGSSRFLTFWTTLPGILTGLAAVLTAAIGLFTLWHGLSASLPAPTAPAQQATSGQPGRTNPAAGGVVRQGEISLDVGAAADLESGQVGTAIPSPDIVFRGGDTPLLQVLGSGHIARSYGPRDKASCVARLTAEPEAFWTVSALKGASPLCLETHSGHVAGLDVVSAPGSGSEQIVLTYRIWQ
jgi:hypothetical protein